MKVKLLANTAGRWTTRKLNRAKSLRNINKTFNHGVFLFSFLVWPICSSAASTRIHIYVYCLGCGSKRRPQYTRRQHYFFFNILWLFFTFFFLCLLLRRIIFDRQREFVLVSLLFDEFNIFFRFVPFRFGYDLCLCEPFACLSAIVTTRSNRPTLLIAFSTTTNSIFLPPPPLLFHL